MNDMRFSQLSSEPESNSENTTKSKSFFSKFKTKKVVKSLTAIILIVAVVLVISFSKDVFMRKNTADMSYSAVFLTNGQVYFGKLAEKTDSEFLLTDVYYLQLNGQTGAQSQLSEPKFSLIKLGNELHGPTDELFINTAHVLFYENLRDDSKVVESIKAMGK